jgi:uncharacterized protein
MHVRLWLSSLFAALMLLVQPVWATNFPVLDGKPVVDQANILTPAEEDRLIGKLLAIEKQSGHQVAVASIHSLEGLDIEDYGLMLGRRWAIGRKGVDDGLMILIAPKDRKMRLEVGVGLEAIVPNDFAERVINDAMKPRFKAGDFAGGIDDAVDMLAVRLNNQPLETDAAATLDMATPDKVETAYSSDTPQTDESDPLPMALKILLGVLWVIIAIPFLILGYLIYAALSTLWSWVFGGGRRVSNWNSASSSVYVDASPTIINRSRSSYVSAPSRSYDPPSSSSSSTGGGGFSGGDGGRFRGGGASGSW